MLRNCFLLLFLSLTSFTLSPPKQVTVYLIGDSTLSIKEKKYYPETGWGMPFVNYFDSTITVDNRAKNGRSTKTFITEGLWQPVSTGMKAGDYLFIQFGHNDEVPTKKSFTTEDDFRKNLTLFINAARSKQAIPVLITPVARRKFDSVGHVVSTHTVYAQIVREVAQRNDVPLIDLDAKSQQLLQQLGVEPSKFLYNHLEPGQNPNYPKGKVDDTHFSELGARRMAELVLKSIEELKLELANHIVKANS
ncbi:rhamnogalacturonan acetylesterase [Mucilaginibacter sp. PAMB04168]|uniref:rhamnogalacturonan acetylesterase n=1 Tax=Mucilaginibacter sp. PAMB04168 TaxID=3138567 RepID=UPI0031F68DFA